MKKKTQQQPNTKPAAKPTAPAPAQQALTIAGLLGTPDPALQVQAIQQLLALGAAPVLTLVIQVDTRAPEGTVWVSNVGPAITGPVAHMMLAAATRYLAERQAVAAQQRVGPAVPTGETPPSATSDAAKRELAERLATAAPSRPARA